MDFDAKRLFLGFLTEHIIFLGSISAALSSQVFVPPRERRALSGG